VLRGDLFGALEGPAAESIFPGGKPQFDAVLTNPPYIPGAAIAGLSKEVRDYEPHMALDGGEDGLAIVRRIIEQVPRYLKPSGLLLMEIGDDQGAEALSMALQTGAFREAGIIKDLAGKDRILRAKAL
jgi:release factor glutamine methyltransferase